MHTNRLIFGDNLHVLPHLAAGSVDLIYLDPPFNSARNYSALFAQRGAQKTKAFVDTWQWDAATAQQYQQLTEQPGEVAQILTALRQILGTSTMLAYLTMMAPRLQLLRHLLKPNGNIFLHCDPSASHYLRILMDHIFKRNFVGEIIWCYDTGGRSKTSFPAKHDTLLHYSNSAKPVFYYDNVALPRDPSTMHETVVTDAEGRPYQRNIKNGKEYRYYLDKGVLPNDWWTDIPALNPAAKERLGYDTQKPEALLERLIQACTQEGDLVLDPFCGCGTTIAVCERLKRRWIGIDIAHVAMSMIKRRLRRTRPQAAIPNIEGTPRNLTEAHALAMRDSYQFQCWALDLVGACPQSRKHDNDVQGVVPFNGNAQHVAVSVTTEAVSPQHVRDLARSATPMAALISLQPPKANIRAAAADCGQYTAACGTAYGRVQILTVADLLGGQALRYPAT